MFSWRAAASASVAGRIVARRPSRSRAVLAAITSMRLPPPGPRGATSQRELVADLRPPPLPALHELLHLLPEVRRDLRVHVREHGLQGRGRGLLRDPDRVRDEVVQLLLEVAVVDLVPEVPLLEVRLEPGDRVLPPPLLHLRGGAVPGRVVARGVWPHTVRDRFDQGRAPARAGLLDGLARD